MPWIWTGRITAVVFALLAATRITRPDPVLWVLVYLGACATAITVARNRHVVRWALVILIVFPIEMVVISLPIGPWPQVSHAYPDPDVHPYQTIMDASGMTLVALWSTLLVASRRFRTDQVL